MSTSETQDEKDREHKHEPRVRSRAELDRRSTGADPGVLSRARVSRAREATVADRVYRSEILGLADAIRDLVPAAG